MENTHNVVQFDNGHRTAKKLVEILARALVDHPDAVSVSEISGTSWSILELTVAKEDIGKIIGKQGRTAGAMRTLLNAVATKTKKRSALEIVE